MKIKSMIGTFMIVAACLCGGSLWAQNDGGGPPQGGPGGGPGGPGGNFDPAQFQQQMMQRVRQSFSVTNDDEWTVIQGMVQKVMDARRDAGPGGGGMGFAPGGPPGGGNRSNNSNDKAGEDSGRRRFGPPQSEEQRALQKVLDDEKSTPAAVKDALAKFRASKKEKQAKLEAAQENLKSVLTPRQEAQAVLMGLVQ